MTEHFHITSIGYSHIKADKVCQDFSSSYSDGERTIITACDGHGGEAFYHWFADRNNADEVMRDIVNVPAGETHMDQWQAQILARVMQKAFCIFVAPECNRQMLEDMRVGDVV